MTPKYASEPTEQVKRGQLATAKGFANENRFLAALLERGFNASRVDLPHSSYDIIVELSRCEFVRVQVKTVSTNNSISFTGGVRGSADRKYKSEVKSHTQNTETSDIVVGIETSRENGDSATNYYFVPAILIEKLGQKSITTEKLNQAKNDWKILKQCKNPNFVVMCFPELLKNQDKFLFTTYEHGKGQ